MQATIHMAQALLDRGKELWQENRYQEATRVLSRLLGLRVIPPQIAERAQFYLGDMNLAQGQYSKARRHLAAALVNGPRVGETHFLMACAVDWDEEPDTRLAFRHYRRAVQLEPGQPLYSSVYALQRLRRQGERAKYDRESLRRIREAFAAEPDDADIVYNYASGLVEMGRYDEAELAVRRARRRWTGHPAFEELWHDLLCRRGLLPRGPASTGLGPRLRVVADDEPIILRFSRAPARPAAVKPLSPHARLKAVLDTLSKHEVTSLGRALGIPLQSDPVAERTAVRRALLDPKKLQSLLASLSHDGRHVIRLLTDAGGTAEIKRLRLRVDQPSEPRGPYGRRRRVIPLDELRRAGLVFETAGTSQQPDAEVATIPSDLRKLLRELMANVN